MENRLSLIVTQLRDLNLAVDFPIVVPVFKMKQRIGIIQLERKTYMEKLACKPRKALILPQIVIIMILMMHP